MHELLYVIVMPALMGLVTLFFPKKARLPAGLIALVSSAWMFVKTIQIFARNGIVTPYSKTVFTIGDVFQFDFALKLTGFNAFVLLFIALFGVLIVLYSIGYWFRDREIHGIYYSYILWTLAGAACAVLSDNLLLLLVWKAFRGSIPMRLTWLSLLRVTDCRSVLLKAHFWV